MLHSATGPGGSQARTRRRSGRGGPRAAGAAGLCRDRAGGLGARDAARGASGLDRSRFFRTDLPADGVWSLSCFRVRAGWRGRGLTRVLTEAALAFARTQGGSWLEVYPTDTDARRSPQAVYTGIASTFRALGFEEVQRLDPAKPMMRKAL
ncbi:MAG: GNAT family N-acetyltransferase [Paracoccaceae bacterium]